MFQVREAGADPQEAASLAERSQNSVSSVSTGWQGYSWSTSLFGVDEQGRRGPDHQQMEVNVENVELKISVLTGNGKPIFVGFY